MLRVLICLVLAQLITADATTVTNVDFVQSIGQTNLLERVERKVDVTYSYQLAGDQGWHQYEGMNIIIDLPFSQYIKVKYNVAVASSNTINLEMRVRVDGKENTQMRGHTTSVWHPGVFRYGQIFLSKGKHQIVVEYRTGNTVINYQWDWNSAIFKVEYFKQATQ